MVVLGHSGGAAGQWLTDLGASGLIWVIAKEGPEAIKDLIRGGVGTFLPSPLPSCHSGVGTHQSARPVAIPLCLSLVFVLVLTVNGINFVFLI